MTFLFTLISASACPIGGGCGLTPLLLVGVVLWGGYNLWLKTEGRKGLRLLFIVLASVLLTVWLFFINNRSAVQASGNNVFPQEGYLGNAAENAGLPRLICLGAGSCVPCRMMNPVREKLRNDYKNQMVVEYYDVSKDPAIGHRFGIRSIPTIIFVDAEGKELFRNVGYMSENDILNTWRKIGVDLDSVVTKKREVANEAD